MKKNNSTVGMRLCSVVVWLCCLLSCPNAAMAQSADSTQVKKEQTQQVKPSSQRNKRTKVDVPQSPKKHGEGLVEMVDLAGDTVRLAATDSVMGQLASAEILEKQKQHKRDSAELADFGKERIVKLDPTRAMWLSALCPGLGQVYNRRYWKIPIVVGAFAGLAYATSWNNRMLTDYTKAYGDAMDSDPSTNSYMDFYPPTVHESDLDMAWLQKRLKAKKDYFRRNRDLCIISMVGVYLLCMVDAYVDASLANFDISDDLSMNVKPAVLGNGYSNNVGVGLRCAVTF